MATDSSLYWLIAVPSNAKQPAGALSGNAKVHKFDVPDCLKVGTLDQLMTLSDDLAKQDASCGAVVTRFQAAFQELCSNKPTQPGKKKKEDSKKDKKGTMLKISMDDYSGGSSKKQLPSEYVQKFRWIEKYLVQAQEDSLPNIIERLVAEINTADNDLKKKMKSLSDDRTKLEAIERKEGGNLLVKGLDEFIGAKDMLESDYLTTQLVVVPKERMKEFEETYWKLESLDKERKVKSDADRTAAAEEERKRRAELKTPGGQMEAEVEEEQHHEHESAEEKEARENAEADEAKANRMPKCDSIVPGSIKKLSEDKEFGLYKICMLKKGSRELEYTKGVLRAERFTVRPHTYDPEGVKKAKEEHKQLSEKIFEDWTDLVKILQVKFTVVFVAWIHLKSIRAFVESVLRYGLAGGTQYSYNLIEPASKSEAKTRKALEGIYKSLGDESGGSKDDQEMLNSQFGEFFPYVSVTIDLNENKDE